MGPKDSSARLPSRTSSPKSAAPMARYAVQQPDGGQQTETFGDEHCFAGVLSQQADPFVQTSPEGQEPAS